MMNISNQIRLGKDAFIKSIKQELSEGFMFKIDGVVYDSYTPDLFNIIEQEVILFILKG